MRSIVVDSREYSGDEYPALRQVIVCPGHELLASLNVTEIRGSDPHSEEDEVLGGGDMTIIHSEAEWGLVIVANRIQVYTPILQLIEDLWSRRRDFWSRWPMRPQGCKMRHVVSVGSSGVHINM
eukprot:FR740809.1.p2 GENE.FR740809.1~~FR740809.1.p2  ORF type:complete len:124 (-),score=9.67 FR740809.1:159-530(-)